MNSLMNMLCQVLQQAYPAVNPNAAFVIAQNALTAADLTMRLHWMHAQHGAMFGESMANILVTDGLLLDKCWEESSL